MRQGRENGSVEAAVGRSNCSTIHPVPVTSRIHLSMNKITTMRLLIARGLQKINLREDTYSRRERDRTRIKM